jgi:hypothetical protein
MLYKSMLMKRKVLYLGAHSVTEPHEQLAVVGLLSRDSVYIKSYKGKVTPLQALCGPEGG